ncbi:MAG: hypothetical protein WBW02_14660, partial [Candidatus Sulfotelmatobacter sp.]
MITESTAVTLLPADAEAQRVRYLAEVSQRRRVAISLLQTGRTPEQSESEHAANVEALRAAMKLGAE